MLQLLMLIFVADAADVIIVDGILLLLIVDHSAYTDVVCVVAAVDVDVDSDGANTKKTHLNWLDSVCIVMEIVNVVYSCVSIFSL